MIRNWVCCLRAAVGMYNLGSTLRTSPKTKVNRLAMYAIKGWPFIQAVFDFWQKVTSLRQLIAAEFQISCDRLRLVAGGTTLNDSDKPLHLADKDSVLAFVAPRLPSARHRDGITRGSGEYLDDEAEDERFRLRPGASHGERFLARFLQQQLRVPDVVLQLLFSIRPQTIAAVVMWLCVCPIAARLHIGPLYVLGSIVAVIYVNLGTRKPGEQSAYSVFNEGIRALPGQLNADAIDDQMRRGQM